METKDQGHFLEGSRKEDIHGETPCREHQFPSYKL